MTVAHQLQGRTSCDGHLYALRKCLCGHPLCCSAVYLSFVYGFFYVLPTTTTEVFEATYGSSQGEAGLAYLGLILSPLFGSLLLSAL